MNAFSELRKKKVDDLTSLDIVVLSESNDSVQMAAAEELASLRAELAKREAKIKNFEACSAKVVGIYAKDERLSVTFSFDEAVNELANVLRKE